MLKTSTYIKSYLTSKLALQQNLAPDKHIQFINKVISADTISAVSGEVKVTLSPHWWSHQKLVKHWYCINIPFECKQITTIFLQFCQTVTANVKILEIMSSLWKITVMKIEVNCIIFQEKCVHIAYDHYYGFFHTPLHGIKMM